MAALGRFLRRWLPLWPPAWPRRWRIVATVDAGDEIPDLIADHGVVLVGPTSRPTWAAFDCPCRRDHRIMINLDPSRRPVWRVESRTPLSIRPSIDDRATHRRCHFFIARGRTIWAHDEEETR